MIRDEEIKRLVAYAKGMGTIIYFKKVLKSKYDAECTTDGKEITVYTTNNTSKLQLVLTLIHEISHLKAFINNGRQQDPKVEEALDALDAQEDLLVHRKRIRDMEVEDAKHWLEIYNDTDCKFPLYKLYLEKEYDLWQYEIYYETGKFPTKMQKRAKIKKLKDQHRLLGYDVCE